MQVSEVFISAIIPDFTFIGACVWIYLQEISATILIECHLLRLVVAKLRLFDRILKCVLKLILNLVKLHGFLMCLHCLHLCLLI